MAEPCIGREFLQDDQQRHSYQHLADMSPWPLQHWRIQEQADGEHGEKSDLNDSINPAKRQRRRRREQPEEDQHGIIWP
jgi:hypothetical protein